MSSVQVWRHQIFYDLKKNICQQISIKSYIYYNNGEFQTRYLPSTMKSITKRSSYPTYIVEDIRKSVGRIFYYNYQYNRYIFLGTCFVFHHGLLLTCCHVVHNQSLNQLYVTFENFTNNSYINCFRFKNILYSSKSLDYALFEVDWDGSQVPKDLTKSDNAISKPGQVCIVGYSDITDKGYEICPVIPPECNQINPQPLLRVPFNVYSKMNYLELTSHEGFTNSQSFSYSVSYDGQNINIQFTSASEIRNPNLNYNHQMGNLTTIYSGESNNQINYLASMAEGSSGSPIFNEQGQLIAMHHSGNILNDDGEMPKYYIARGVNISAIISDIKSQQNLQM
ncbi:serine protease FAM111A-like [Chiloscyllium plagiosum]|uniref:serine protease FAM111A-like n=1 Tax=Chiloscyllium plagiosum TaxID=36176 RepID=UPI001CB8500B|nr:serine protease FAM111A-like [Chiloscyllium plagiosum]